VSERVSIALSGLRRFVDNQGQRAPLRVALAPGYHISAPSALTLATISPRLRRLLWLPYLRAFGAYSGYHISAPSVLTSDF